LTDDGFFSSLFVEKSDEEKRREEVNRTKRNGEKEVLEPHWLAGHMSTIMRGRNGTRYIYNCAGGAGPDSVGDPARHGLRHVPVRQPRVQLHQLLQVHNTIKNS
jgi:hypothetical protein